MDLIGGQEVGLDFGKEPDLAFPIQCAKGCENVSERRVGIEHRINEPDLFCSPLQKNADAPAHFLCAEESRLSPQVPVAAVAASPGAASSCFKIGHAVWVGLPGWMTSRGQTFLECDAG